MSVPPSRRTSESGAAYAHPVLTVSELVAAARRLIEQNLPLAWISGEVSNFMRAASGHCYFVLKDGQAQVRCVFFRSRAALTGFVVRDGMQVEVRAQASLYEARGEFQLTVDALRQSGAGALYEKFARLKADMEARGWFAASRKRPLPAFPRAIGVITSPRAAALRDFLITLRRRSPQVAVVLYPCAVQGHTAAAAIAEAIRTANERAHIDGIEALVLCRGGGSIEDLWSFNEEAVAQAIIDSVLPIVSGVGHETDFTIADFVADVRAPTPTGAAQLVAPSRDELEAVVRNLFLHLRSAVGRRLEREMQRVDYLDRRLQHPAARLRVQRDHVAHLAQRLRRGWDHFTQARGNAVHGLETRWVRSLATPLPQGPLLAEAGLRLGRAWQRLAAAHERRIEQTALALRHLNPGAVLERGYSIVTTGPDAVVQDSGALAVGQTVHIRFAQGAADAAVTATE